jgi:uncharacterized membrane protein
MGLILFQACRGDALAPTVTKVEDRTAESVLTAGILDVRKIMLDASRPLYVEFSGSGDAKLVRAQRFYRAIGTATTCAEAPALADGTLVWAIGNQPPWQLSASRAGAQLLRPGVAPVRFPAGPFASAARPGVARVIDAWSAQDGGSLRLEIVPGLCSDGRSESAYGARATLRFGSTSYEGCAARF